ADADQPIRLNTTTRRYFHEIAKLPDYGWLNPYLARLENSSTAVTAANHIRSRDAELDAQLRTSMSPTMLSAGMNINLLRNAAEAQVAIRRWPNETREEIVARLRKIIHDPAVEVSPAAGQTMPTTEPSSMTSTLYQAMEKLFAQSAGRAMVIPYMSRGAT